MTYDRYYEKTVRAAERRDKAKKWLRSHFVLLAVLLILIVFSVMTLLYMKGTFIGNLSVIDAVYGEEPEFSSKAFLSGVDYRYLYPDGGVSGTCPSLPGSYTVTASTTNPFGTVRSLSSELNIKKRKLKIGCSVSSYIYGETPDVYEAISAEGLADGDRIAYAECEFPIYVGTYQVRIAGVRIENSEKEDVTDCYDIEYKKSSLSVDRRVLGILTGSASKEYDGTPLYEDTYAVTEGTLAFDDRLELVFDRFNDDNTITQPTSDIVSVTLNHADVRIYSADQRVDINYEIKLVPGSLVINKRNITVRTSGLTKVYDDIPFEDHTVEITGGSLLPGHTLASSGFSSYYNAGIYANRADIYVTDGASRLDAYYNISCDFGRIEISKRPITVTSLSSSKVYDGTPLSYGAANLTEGKLVSNHYISFISFASVTTAKSVKNTFTANIRSEERHPNGTYSIWDVTNNYDIRYEYGNLSITPRPVKIKVFLSGLINNQYFHFVGTMPYEDRIEGDTVTIDNIPVSVPYEEFEKNIRIRMLRISEDRTFCYDIEFELVKDKALYLTFMDQIKNGDPSEGDDDKSAGIGGTYIGSDGDDGGDSDSGDPTGSIPGSRPSNSSKEAGYVKSDRPGLIYLRQRSFGNYTGKGWTEPAVYYKGVYGSPLYYAYMTLQKNSYKATDHIVVGDYTDDGLIPVPYFTQFSTVLERENDVAFIKTILKKDVAYDIIPMLDPQVLAGLKGMIYDPAYEQFVYNHYIEVPELTAEGLRTIIKEAGLDPESPYIISEVAEFVSHAAKYNMNFEEIPAGEDSVLYFLNVSKEGVCSHFASAATLIYRLLGIPARYTSGFAAYSTGNMELCPYTFQNAHAWVEIYIKSVGWVPVEVTSTDIVDSGEGLPPITETLRYNRVSFHLDDAEKQFDGTPLFPGEPVIEGENPLLPGHRLIAEANDSLTFCGKKLVSSSSFKVVDGEGNDVTSKYIIEETRGAILIVTPVVIDQELEIYVGQRMKLPLAGDLLSELSPALQKMLSDVDPSVDFENYSYLSFDSDFYMDTIRGRSDSSLLYSDGILTGVTSALDKKVSVIYEIGKSDADTYQSNPEIVIEFTVDVIPFENVIIHDGTAPREAIRFAPGESVSYDEAPEGIYLNYLMIETAGAQKYFDGEYLTAEGFSILQGKLNRGDTIVITYPSSILYVGETPNKCGVLAIKDIDGKDVTDNYFIDVYTGMLRVTPGEYRTRDRSFEIMTGVPYEVSGFDWTETVSKVPVSYDVSDTNMIRLENTKMIGLGSGNSELIVNLEGVDLNGDGENEYLPTQKRVEVSVRNSGINMGAIALPLSLTAAAVVFAAVFILLVRRKNTVGKEDPS